MKIILMCDGPVGKEIAEWLLANFFADIGLMVMFKENELCDLAKRENIPFLIFESDKQIELELIKRGSFDLGLLAWWPKIIPVDIISLPKNGFINTHPSLLPYNRGKNYNFWAIVEEVPFGVTLHFVEKGIDSGDIIAQKQIEYDWTDNGETLYKKACKEMFVLFKDSYPQIRSGNIKKIPQDNQNGSFHLSNEMEKACLIDLNKFYQARNIINLLRARTFEGKNACRFSENGNDYEIRIVINKVAK